jgi:hypothetical protein
VVTAGKTPRHETAIGYCSSSTRVLTSFIYH